MFVPRTDLGRPKISPLVAKANASCGQDRRRSLYTATTQEVPRLDGRSALEATNVIDAPS